MMKRNIKVWFYLACLASSMAAPWQPLLDIIDVAAISNLSPHQLEMLAEEIMRTKRSSAQALTSVVSKASSGLLSKFGLMEQASAEAASFIASAFSKPEHTDEHPGYSYEQSYAATSNLFFNEHSMRSQVGVQQCDPLDPLILSLAIQKIIADLRSPLKIWYSDDGTITSSPDTVAHDLQDLIERFKDVGLEINSTSPVYGPLPAYVDYPLSAYGVPAAPTHFSPLAPTGYESYNFPTHLDENTKRLRLYETMEKSAMAPRGMVVTPHHLATQSALAILREGGTAIEAMVAAAATIAVVYPHFNSIGGDGFWLIIPPDGNPVVIEACGGAGSLATPELYQNIGVDKIPFTGPKSAITVAGTVGGWQEALDYVSKWGYQKISLKRLLADAITYAENGFPISISHINYLNYYMASEIVYDEFNSTFLKDGKVPKVGDMLNQKNLAKTLLYMAENGLNSFYRGDLARLIAEDMVSLGIPITEEDLWNYSPIIKTPLRLKHTHGELYNVPPPTQGLVSLTILGILDKLRIDGKREGEFIHMTVEATKRAFNVRDQYITDPAYMTIDPQLLLSNEVITKLAQTIDADQASSVGEGKGPGDTVWMGIMDNKGFTVTFIQSLFHGFGSGVVLPQTGILWNDRGAEFSLDKNNILSLKPGKKPFHTLNPAAARLNDGRIIIYVTAGGDGQSQYQAAIFHRYVVQKMPLQTSVSAPRWLFGRICDDCNDDLNLEGRFSNETIEYLKERGHNIVMLPSFSDRVGQAGALVRHVEGYMEGAFDPRSDGSAAGF